MGMAETVKKTAKDEKALAATDVQKAATIKAQSDVQVIAKAEIPAKAEPAKKPEADPVSDDKAEAPKSDAKKESDPGKEFVDGIMTEMSLKGASKKRLIRALTEKYGMDKQKVMFRLKRALISERYAAQHEAGH